MTNTKPYILKTLLTAILELKEHPEAKDCIEYVDDFLSHITNEDILKGCSVSWDDANKGFLLLWDDVLAKYNFKADIMVCKDYYHYSFIVRDRDGNYLDSGGESNEIKDWDGFSCLTGEHGHHKDKPFWRDIVDHLEEVYAEENIIGEL